MSVVTLPSFVESASPSARPRRRQTISFLPSLRKSVAFHREAGSSEDFSCGMRSAATHARGDQTSRRRLAYSKTFSGAFSAPATEGHSPPANVILSAPLPFVACSGVISTRGAGSSARASGSLAGFHAAASSGDSKSITTVSASALTTGLGFGGGSGGSPLGLPAGMPSSVPNRAGACDVLPITADQNDASRGAAVRVRETLNAHWPCIWSVMVSSTNGKANSTTHDLSVTFVAVLRFAFHIMLALFGWRCQPSQTVFFELMMNW